MAAIAEHIAIFDCCSARLQVAKLRSARQFQEEIAILLPVPS